MYMVTFLLLQLVITLEIRTIIYINRDWSWQVLYLKNLATIVCTASPLNSNTNTDKQYVQFKITIFLLFLPCQMCKHGKHIHNHFEKQKKSLKTITDLLMSLGKLSFSLRDPNKQAKLFLKQFKWQTVWYYETLIILNTKLWIHILFFPRGKMYYNANCSLKYKRIIHQKLWDI